MKYVPIVFKSLSDKTLGVYFPQTGKNCSEGSEAKWGFQDSPNLINGRKCCLAWAGLQKALHKGRKVSSLGQTLAYWLEDAL